MRYELHMATGDHRSNVALHKYAHPCVCIAARNEDGTKAFDRKVFEARWCGRNGSAVYDLNAGGRAMWVVIEGPIEVRTEKGWEELP